ncbi:MAG: SMP-30/gluconolactonase/LRE family protein [Verrucomicrobiota bacterium]
MIWFSAFAGLAGREAAAEEAWKSLPTVRVGSEIEERLESHLDLPYARYGERELQLDLYRPKNRDGLLPAIVCIHGGGWHKGSRVNHAHVAKALAARGYVAVTISYRLSGEAPFPVQIHDAKAAVRWLRANAEKWGVNPDFIGATGSSAGGHLTALLATSGGVSELEGEGGNADFSSTIQAAVPMGAQTDFLSERNKEISATREIWRAFLGGSQEEVPETYRSASPRAHLDKNDPPVFLMTGEFDDPSTHATAFRRDCLALGIPTGLHVIPGAPHPFLTRQKFFDEAMDRIDGFFEQHLENGSVSITMMGKPPAVSGEWIQLGGGYAGCEGAQWITVDREPTLIYAAHHDGFVFRWSPEKGLTVWRDDSPEATSFRPDGEGGYYVVEQSTRQVTRWNGDGKQVEVLVDRFEGKRLNRPNDLRVHPDGSLWFTDPDFLFKQRPEDVKELEGQYIYRFDVETKEVSAVVKDTHKPNGIAISKDGKWLFYTDSSSRDIARVSIREDGTVGDREVFATSQLFGLDGLTLDSEGRLWSAAKEVVDVYHPDGKKLGSYSFPSKPTAIAFHPDGWICVTTREAAFAAPIEF